MDAKLDVITLGVQELERSVQFYRDGLGFPVEMEDENYVRFATGETQLALFPQELLADDANVSADERGFPGITLAQVIESEEEIQEVLEEVEAAGGQITKPAQKAEWFDGFSGYFADPDGYLWEIVAFA